MVMRSPSSRAGPFEIGVPKRHSDDREEAAVQHGSIRAS
jgi:hypothetical protein